MIYSDNKLGVVVKRLDFWNVGGGVDVLMLPQIKDVLTQVSYFCLPPNVRATPWLCCAQIARTKTMKRVQSTTIFRAQPLDCRPLACLGRQILQ
jgi:hypothetical protein